MPVGVIPCNFDVACDVEILGLTPSCYAGTRVNGGRTFLSAITYFWQVACRFSPPLQQEIATKNTKSTTDYTDEAPLAPIRN